MTQDLTTLDYIVISIPAAFVILGIILVAAWEIIADWKGWDA